MNRFKFLTVLTVAALGATTLLAQEQKKKKARPSKTDATIDPFTMAVEKTGPGAGVIKMAWENAQYSIAFANKK